MNKKQKAADRGDGQAASEIYGERDHNTRATRVDLPPPIRRDYLAACQRWRSAYLHHRAMRRLIEVSV